MTEPVEIYLSFDRAIELLSDSDAAGLSPGEARAWLENLITSDRVHLRDLAGNVMRYSATPAVAAMMAVRATRSAAAGRYNPLARGERSGLAPAPRPVAPYDQLRMAGYAVAGGELNKASARAFGAELELRAAPAAATSTGPVRQLREMLRTGGRKPEFAGIPKAAWRQRAVTKGILFTTPEFEAAWRSAIEDGDVKPLAGAPKRERQSKRVQQHADVLPESAATSQPKATGT